MLCLKSDVLVLYLYWMFLAHGVGSLTINVGSETSKTVCNDRNFKVAGEMIIYSATADSEGQNLTEWNTFTFDIKILTGSDYFAVCTINIQTSLCDGIQGTDICYCKNHTGNVFLFIYNSTISTQQSKASIRASWQNVDFNVASYTSSSIILPEVVVKQDESLKFNTTVKVIEHCEQTVNAEDTNTLTFCVSNLAALYKISVKYGDSSNFTQSPSVCTSYQFKWDSSLNTISFSYIEESGCQRQKNGYCSLQGTVTSTSTTAPSTVPDTVTSTSNIVTTNARETVTSTSTTVTTSATAKPSSSVDYTDTIIGVVVGVGSCLLIAGIVIAVLIYKKEKPKCSDSKIILVIVVTVAGSVVIVGIIIGLLYYCNVCKFKKANKQPKGLTLTETTPPTNETSARHIETKRPLPPLAHLPPHKISPDISGNNEKASNITDKTSNETPNDSPRKKKPRKKRARRNLENGGKNDEQ